MEEPKQLRHETKISCAVHQNDLRHLQVEMLQRYRIPGVLPIGVEEEDDHVFLSYDVSGMVTLAVYLKGRMVNSSEAVRLFREILLTLEEAKAYYLEPGDFALTIEQVYINAESGHVLLMPYPVTGSEADQWFSLIQCLLTDYLWIEPAFPWAHLMDGLRQSDREIKECLSVVRSLEMVVMDGTIQGSGARACLVNGEETEKDPGKTVSLTTLPSRVKLWVQQYVKSRKGRDSKKSDRQTLDQTANKSLAEAESTQLLMHEERFLELTNGQTVPLEQEELFIGRQENLVQVCLEDAAVGRVHCVCKRMGENWFLIDLHSTNGTQINDQPVSAGVSIALTSGDRIRIGNTTIIYR